MTYASRGWAAVETTDFVGAHYRLTVTGDVEVRRTNEKPVLVEARPQGIGPSTLILFLEVESSGEFGGDVVVWKSVSFTREVSARQYHHVTITGETADQTVAVDAVVS